MSSIGMVDSSSEQAGEASGDPLPISQMCLSDIANEYPDDIENILRELRALDGGIISRLEGKVWRNDGVFFEHVFPLVGCVDVEKLCGILDRMGNETFGRSLFGYSVDGDHIHIIHDCSYANRACRCKFKSYFEGCLKTKDGIRRRLRDIGKDWLHIILYYYFRKRGTQKIWIDRVLQGFSLSGKLI